MRGKVTDTKGRMCENRNFRRKKKEIFETSCDANKAEYSALDASRIFCEKAFRTDLRTYGRTNGRTYGRTDGRTYGRTDKPSYRDAKTHLKNWKLEGDVYVAEQDIAIIKVSPVFSNFYKSLNFKRIFY